MTEIDLALLCGAIFACLVSWRVNQRGIIWIMAAGVDFVISTAYWRSGLPFAEGVAGACDAAVCLAVYFGGRQRWEMAVWRLSQMAVAINFLYLAGNIGVFSPIPHDVYSSLLEALNWILLLFIGGMATMQRIGVFDARARRPWSGVHRTLFPLRQERRHPPFTKAW